jgi:hypothetical protein
MSNPALVILSVAVLFSVTLGLWSRTARVVSIHTVPARYRRRVLWWQANAHHAQLVAVAVAAASLCAYTASAVA